MNIYFCNKFSLRAYSGEKGKRGLKESDSNSFIGGPQHLERILTRP